ncbi:MAG: hypothetical protein OXR68_07125 [Alphaproteobacteria bacterium]|nr:hypothetical protein [Alphaproteobacteria bacterium]MDD9920375.1 hypothetical protein [Alphaproteobacteria bacterium]
MADSIQRAVTPESAAKKLINLVEIAGNNGLFLAYRMNPIRKFLFPGESMSLKAVELSIHRKYRQGLGGGNIVKAINKLPDAGKNHALLNLNALRFGLEHLAEDCLIHINLEMGPFGRQQHAKYFNTLVRSLDSDDFTNEQLARCVLEVTERDPLTVHALRRLEKLAKRGIKLALDDLGYGYLDPKSDKGRNNLDSIRKNGVHFHTLKLDKKYAEPMDATECINMLSDVNIPANIIVVEYFSEDTEWQQRLASFAQMAETYLGIKDIWVSMGTDTL